MPSRITNADQDRERATVGLVSWEQRLLPVCLRSLSFNCSLLLALENFLEAKVSLLQDSIKRFFTAQGIQFRIEEETTD